VAVLIRRAARSDSRTRRSTSAATVPTTASAALAIRMALSAAS
jgi:hypothetical protein